jgi:predicted DNA-binding transcriptional regulator AlpA
MRCVRLGPVGSPTTGTDVSRQPYARGVTAAQVQEATGVGRNTAYRAPQGRQVPAPRGIGPRSRRWPASHRGPGKRPFRVTSWWPVVARVAWRICGTEVRHGGTALEAPRRSTDDRCIGKRHRSWPDRAGRPGARRVWRWPSTSPTIIGAISKVVNVGSVFAIILLQTRDHGYPYATVPVRALRGRSDETTRKITHLGRRPGGGSYSAFGAASCVPAQGSRRPGRDHVQRGDPSRINGLRKSLNRGPGHRRG